jgi:hypothetical protein
MAIRLRLQGGDVSAAPPVGRTSQLEADHDRQEVRLSFDDARVSLDVDDWAVLLEKARGTPSASLWINDRRIGHPFSLPDVHTLVSRLTTTPAYQLFLAGLNIAENIGLVPNGDEQLSLVRCELLVRWVPGTIGRGGLFFLPGNFFTGENSAAFDELMHNSKVCRCQVQVDDGPPWAGAYIPYATPFGFTTPVAPEASRLWEDIRNYYYAFR